MMKGAVYKRPPIRRKGRHARSRRVETARKEVSLYLINAANRDECCGKCQNHVRDTNHAEDGVGGWQVWKCNEGNYPEFVKRW